MEESRHSEHCSLGKRQTDRSEADKVERKRQEETGRDRERKGKGKRENKLGEILLHWKLSNQKDLDDLNTF